MKTEVKKHTIKHSTQKSRVLRDNLSRAGKDFFALRNAWVKSGGVLLTLDEISQLRKEGQKG